MSTNVVSRHPTTADSLTGAGEQLLTEDDLARRWRCSTRTVQRIVASSHIPVTDIGRSPRFAPAAVVAYETRSVVASQAPPHELGPNQDGLLVVRQPLSVTSTHAVGPGCFRVVVAHLKGGQAKTKTVFLTALELAEHGVRVLCRDLDQDTASLTHTFRDRGAIFGEGGVARLHRAIALAPYGSPLPFKPQVELIDTPPTKEGSLAGASRADAIIIPAEPEHEAGRALQTMLEAIELLRLSNPYLRYVGLVPTRVRTRLSDHAAYLRVMSQLAQSVGCPVLEPILDSRWVRRGSNREHQYRPLATRLWALAQEHRRYAR